MGQLQHPIIALTMPWSDFLVHNVKPTLRRVQYKVACPESTLCDLTTIEICLFDDIANHMGEGKNMTWYFGPCSKTYH